MARAKSRVEIEGLDEVIAKLKHPSLIRQPVEEMLESAAKTGKKASVDAIDGGLGIATRSIGYRVSESSAAVFSALPKGKMTEIDRGRKRGGSVRRMLPGLIRWTDAVGASEAAIVIALRIKRSGTRGKKFVDAGREEVHGVIPSLLKELEHKISARWLR